MKKALTASIVGGTLLLGSAVVAPAQAQPVPQGPVVAKASTKQFENCTAVNKAYPGGIAKSGSAKNLKTANGKKVLARSRYKPKVSASWYRLNSTLDRDKDGIACER